MKTKALALLVLASLASVTAHAWGGQGHRLVALVATDHLTPSAKQNVAWLLPDESLADVSSWADQYLEGNNQTALWHYLNIPPGATGYDRDRDCPLAHYVAVLEDKIKQHRWDVRPTGVPADWAVQSFQFAKAALLPQHANVDEAYYRAQIPIIEERLALAGLRLASLLNGLFTTPRPAK
jgi:S1/P1 nuclease